MCPCPCPCLCRHYGQIVDEEWCTCQFGTQMCVFEISPYFLNEILEHPNFPKKRWIRGDMTKVTNHESMTHNWWLTRGTLVICPLKIIPDTIPPNARRYEDAFRRSSPPRVWITGISIWSMTHKILLIKYNSTGLTWKIT